MAFNAKRLVLPGVLCCFVGWYCSAAVAVEGDLYFLGIALDQQTIPGGWAGLGAPGAWQSTIAGTTLDSQL